MGAVLLPGENEMLPQVDKYVRVLLTTEDQVGSVTVVEIRELNQRKKLWSYWSSHISSTVNSKSYAHILYLDIISLYLFI